MNEIPNFDSMNEVDVREEIVRPLLTRLGYRHGSEAYVQTEVPLSYSSIFLGRKKPDKDPPLRGRADYVCGVVAAGRWVVEVKAPSEEITESTVQQAHTYAAHPEVAAYYFMVTNGKQFRLFETGRLVTPLLEWSFADNESKFLNIFNILCPDAIRRRAKFVLADPGEPLGPGLHSKLDVLNGSVVYMSHSAGQLDKLMSSLDGVVLPVSGGRVGRDTDGRIHASVSIASVAPLMKSMGAIGLGDDYDFYSSDLYISADQERPTIFQNFVTKGLRQGTSTSLAGMQTLMPFDLDMTAFTEVVGYVDKDEFFGAMRIEAEMTIGQMNPMIAAFVRSQFGLTSGKHHIIQTGKFNARLASAI